METIEENVLLTAEEKLQRVKKAKGSLWYDNWRPYCMLCPYGGRMNQRDYGFCCPSCGNAIGWNLTRLKESPFNRK